MRSSIDPVKILARRFVSLPPLVRMKIAEKLLRWREENQEAESSHQQPTLARPRRKSLLEQFWDEVEAAHDDELFPSNPFADQNFLSSLYAVRDELPRPSAYSSN
jgi:hypothetical protein